MIVRTEVVTKSSLVGAVSCQAREKPHGDEARARRRITLYDNLSVLPSHVSILFYERRNDLLPDYSCPWH